MGKTLGKVIRRQQDVVGIAEDGEIVKLGILEAGSMFPVVEVTWDVATLKAGDGTRFLIPREDVVLNPY